MAVEALSRSWKISCHESAGHSLVGEGTWKEKPVILAQPLTYMNESGAAVSALVKSRHVPVEQLLVICDDLALPTGAVRLRAQGSAGGHHGLESIIAALGNERFPRLRIGIGPFPPKSDASEFVLGPFDGGEREKVITAIEGIPQICELWLEQGIQKAMTVVNSKKEL